MNPSQERVLRELLLAGRRFPQVDPNLRAKIAGIIEDGLAVAPQGPAGLVVTKSALTQVHQCEGLYSSQAEAPFEWSIELVAGVLTHLAIQHQHQDRRTREPATYVKSALEVAAVDSSIANWLATSPRSHQLEVERRCVTLVEQWTDFWPELPDTWRVRGEAAYATSVANGRVTLVARPDLVIGPTPKMGEARQAVVDLKTSVSLYPESREEAWFYALVVLLRVGVPPHSSIVYSIPSGTWHPEPEVTEGTLVAAARRVVDGIMRMDEIANGRVADLTPNVATFCRWCPAQASCPAYKLAIDRARTG